MHELKKRIIIFLLAIILLISTGCNIRIVKLEQSATETSEPSASPSADRTAPSSEAGSFKYDRGLVDFGDMKYTHPDYDSVASHINAITAMLTDGSDGKAILKAYDKLEDEFLDFYSQYNLLQVYSSENVNDKEKSKEVEDLSEQYAELGVLGTKLEIKIYNSEFKDTVFWDWTERDFHNLLVAQKLYDDEYVQLSKKQTKLTNDYWDVMNNTTVSVNGKDYTLSELQNSDTISQEYIKAWYEKANEAVGKLYLQLISVNKKIAEKAGYANYNDFAYDFVYERDYTPEKIQAFHQTVKNDVSDVMMKVYSSLSENEYMGLSLAMMGSDQINLRRGNIENYVKTISPEMSEAYHYLNDYHLSVFTDSADSQAGAYTTFFPHYDTPFIYINETGGYNDVLTFIHEFGHFYGFYVGGKKAMKYQSTDVSEIMSQADEMLFLPTMKNFYGDNSYYGIVKYQMFNYLYVLVQGCLYDEFQQYVYTHDVQTVDDLNQAFTDISESYKLGQNFYSLDLGYMWIDVMHNFECPLYYISYSASIIPAFEIFDISNTDRQKAIDIYNSIVHSNPRNRLGQVLDDSGLASPFEEQTLKGILNNIEAFVGIGTDSGNK